MLLVRMEFDEERVDPAVRAGGGIVPVLELAALLAGASGLTLSTQVEIDSWSTFLFLEG